MIKERLIEQFKETKKHLEVSSHPLNTIREVYNLMKLFFEYMEGKDAVRSLQPGSDQESLLPILQRDKEESGSERALGEKEAT